MLLWRFSELCCGADGGVGILLVVGIYVRAVTEFCCGIGYVYKVDC